MHISYVCVTCLDIYHHHICIIPCNQSIVCCPSTLERLLGSLTYAYMAPYGLLFYMDQYLLRSNCVFIKM